MSCLATYAPNGFVARFAGVVTGAEIYEAGEDMYAHAYEPSLRYCLFDFTDVTTLDIDTATIKRIAARDRAYLDSHADMLAAIVAPVPLHLGLARMWEAYADGTHVDPFVHRSRASAVMFLRSHGIDL